MESYRKTFSYLIRRLFFVVSFRLTLLFVFSWLLFWASFNVLLWAVEGFENSAPAVFYKEAGTKVFLSVSSDQSVLWDVLLAMGAILAISMVCYILVVRALRNNVLRLVLAWFSFHGWNFVFGMVIYSFLSSTSLSVVADCFLMGDFMKLIIAELSLLGLCVSGLLVAKPSFEYIIRFHSSLYLGKVKYLIQLLMLIPFLAGSGVVSLVFYDILPVLVWIMVLYLPSLVCIAFRMKRLNKVVQYKGNGHHRHKKMPAVQLN